MVGLCAVVFAEVDQISCRSTYWALLRGSQTFIPIIGGSHLQTNSYQGTRRRSCCRKGGCWWQFVDWCVTSWIDLNLNHHLIPLPALYIKLTWRFSSSALEGFLLGLFENRLFWLTCFWVPWFTWNSITTDFEKLANKSYFFPWNCSKDINLRTLNSLFFSKFFVLIKNKGTPRKIKHGTWE